MTPLQQQLLYFMRMTTQPAIYDVLLTLWNAGPVAGVTLPDRPIG